MKPSLKWRLYIAREALLGRVKQDEFGSELIGFKVGDRNAGEEQSAAPMGVRPREGQVESGRGCEGNDREDSQRV